MDPLGQTELADANGTLKMQQQQEYDWINTIQVTWLQLNGEYSLLLDYTLKKE